MTAKLKGPVSLWPVPLRTSAPSRRSDSDATDADPPVLAPPPADVVVAMSTRLPSLMCALPAALNAPARATYSPAGVMSSVPCVLLPDGTVIVPTHVPAREERSLGPMVLAMFVLLLLAHPRADMARIAIITEIISASFGSDILKATAP